jgi:hypothetical protein
VRCRVVGRCKAAVGGGGGRREFVPVGRDLWCGVGCYVEARGVIIGAAGWVGGVREDFAGRVRCGERRAAACAAV